MACDAAGVVAAVRAVAAAVAEQHAELNRLDREIGDGDHGENLNRGFRAVLGKLDVTPPDSPGSVLKLVAITLISTVGGAAGPLYGTAFLRAATSAGDAETIGADQVVAALAAARDGVVARGKAEPGDKTMVDALTPAVNAATGAAVTCAAVTDAATGAAATGAAATGAAATGAGVADVLRAAAVAAQAGVQSSVPLVARKGRASYLGERSAGHADPGATSTAVILRALAVAAGDKARS